MDKQLEDAIRTLAGEHGVDPGALLDGFSSVGMPPELARVVAGVLGAIDGFADGGPDGADGGTDTAG
jgi:hypothetical protein